MLTAATSRDHRSTRAWRGRTGTWVIGRLPSRERRGRSEGAFRSTLPGLARGYRTLGCLHNKKGDIYHRRPVLRQHRYIRAGETLGGPAGSVAPEPADQPVRHPASDAHLRAGPARLRPVRVVDKGNPNAGEFGDELPAARERERDNRTQGVAYGAAHGQLPSRDSPDRRTLRGIRGGQEVQPDRQGDHLLFVRGVQPAELLSGADVAACARDLPDRTCRQADLLHLGHEQPERGRLRGPAAALDPPGPLARGRKHSLLQPLPAKLDAGRALRRLHQDG